MILLYVYAEIKSSLVVTSFRNILLICIVTPNYPRLYLCITLRALFKLSKENLRNLFKYKCTPQELLRLLCYIPRAP